MTETVTAAAAPKGLIARAFGVVVAPRATYAAIAAHPRVLGALLLVLVISTGAAFGLLSTTVGQQAALDQQIRAMESTGRVVSDAQYAQLERFLPYYGYIGAVYIAVWIVFSTLALAGLMLGIFNAFLGGDARFKQVYAVVVHSGFLFSLQSFFTVPINYLRESLTSPTSLSVFVPFLEETSFAARFLGTLDLFIMWWMVNLAIGLGVLYKRRTGPIAVGLLLTYLAIALIIAAVRSALSGA